jgi:ABC-type nitrate/sulfonate/bicarbonate transport system substrate-binding protein|tara:strand:- start:241 stop:486 length:246 start_codon:yes stop_codon:yes gene_type:complete
MNKKYIKENKTLLREFLGALIKAVAQRKANKLVKDLRKQSPENAKAIDDMHKLASSINQRIKNLEKTDPAKAKILKQQIGF